jgi:hypothetical protein
MSIERKDGKFWGECDECGDTTESKDTFDAVILDLKTEAWRIDCNRGNWTHVCMVCNRTKAASPTKDVC